MRFAALPIVLISIICVTASYISVRFAVNSKLILDAAVTPGSIENLKKGIVHLAILVIIQLILQVSGNIINLKTEASLQNKLRKNLFETLLHKEYSAVSSYHSGELLSRLNGDIRIVGSTVVSIFPDALAFISRIILGFFALYKLDKDFALIFLIVGPFVMVIARIYSKKIKPLHKKCRQSYGKVHSFMLEALRSILVVKSFGVYDTMINSADILQKENMRLVIKRGFISIIANILFYISLTVGYYFAIGWCAYKISLGVMTIGSFAAIIQLVGQVQTPFKELASVLPQFFAMSASAERIYELESLPDDKSKYGLLDTEKVYSEMKSIFFDGVTFSYESENVLDNASVSIPKGSMTAVSGTSGIGKTTLFKLILGIEYPQKGSVGIECFNGDKYISDASVRRLFAYVPQGNFLLSGTVSENICFIDSKQDKERMLQAAENSCVTDFINDLPYGYDTMLGEGGFGLSEGQMQRIAVARALYSNTPVILLDEATSALDEETERRMLTNIKALSGKTCIIISHKECALSLSDYIITIKNGHTDLKKSF